jgi:hypothetical protein
VGEHLKSIHLNNSTYIGMKLRKRDYKKRGKCKCV